MFKKQQRIRAVLDFVQGTYALDGDEVTKKWRGLNFEELSTEEKKGVFGYKFVVRILPAMEEEGIRKRGYVLGGVWTVFRERSSADARS